MSAQRRNNYFPLHFHDVHGENIELTWNKTIACRANNVFCRGIVFSNRPVAVGEPVVVKCLEIAPDWSGALRIGFTMNDPVTLKSNLPRYACPDLTQMHGNWAKAVGQKYARKSSILCYYVDESGDVHYRIDSEEFGIIFGGVNTSGKLWAVLDIYGSTVAVKFLDPNTLNPDYSEKHYVNSASILTKEKDERKQPLSFHNMHGRNVILNKNRTIVSRKPGAYSEAYIFTELPIEIGKTIKMSVRQIDRYFNEELLFDKESLLYGLTSCDPKKINPRELPENEYHLLLRSEYWIVKKISYPFDIGDTIMFKLNNQGQVVVTVNEVTYNVLDVDSTRPLWIFIKLSHSISMLKLSGTTCSGSLRLCGSQAQQNPAASLFNSGMHNSNTSPANSNGSSSMRPIGASLCAVGRITEHVYERPGNRSFYCTLLRNVDASCETLGSLRISDEIKAENSHPSTSGYQSSSECLICCEQQVDCALYRCGHMCMCFDCASTLWKSSSAHCPICRKSILDVIKIYK